MKNNGDRNWYIYDASDKILGRLATEVADSLRGKKGIDFASNKQSANKVVVVNCAKIKVSGKKQVSKVYHHFSGFHGGLKSVTFQDLMKSKPEEIMKIAVKGMLPKNKLQSPTLKNLYLYKDENHPHSNVKFVNYKQNG